ncbi:2,3-diaminopropionate biosynthesis protein SbnA [Paenibacillus sp. NPDC057967]|uniref:2,3-diaminopropionate biosynthesis protein SbnA n=1 Tax=Paenibacillus sp. NPDC057967 TaxID=3346293 RepID=UPI0036DA2AE9
MINNKLNILNHVGDTPYIQLFSDHFSNIELFVKFEFLNPTGSVKDRAANYIIRKLLQNGEINRSTLIMESSSGNFGVSLANYCKKYHLNFYCVIDELISPINEMLIRAASQNVYKVMERDENGGFLLNRLKKIRELQEQFPNSYWINQYQNPYNSEAYYETLGKEIVNQMPELDYLFVGVSSGGTITGLSQRIKNDLPHCKIIAVDVEGSVVFGGSAKKRFIPGIGSSLVPPILENARIDDIVIVNEVSSINNCHELLHSHGIFVGGSSGSVVSAVKTFFKGKKFNKPPKVMGIFCDRGDRYATTIFNRSWIEATYYSYSQRTGED